MNETVNQENMTNQNAGTEEQSRTFTQAELDQIVSDRLSREKAKYADYDSLKDKAKKFDQMEEASKSELQKATERADSLQQQLDAMTRAENTRQIRQQVAQDTGVPADLLTADTQEACKAQAEAILKFANPSAYPAVKDGGEVRVTTKKTTNDQFADWFKQFQ